jgi:hypothetical protein
MHFAFYLVLDERNPQSGRGCVTDHDEPWPGQDASLASFAITVGVKPLAGEPLMDLYQDLFPGYERCI